MIKYKATASTMKEAAELASEMLCQIVEEEGRSSNFITVTLTRTTDGEDFAGARVILLPPGVESLEEYKGDVEALPSVFIGEYEQKEGTEYRLYLVYDIARLPFYFRYAFKTIGEAGHFATVMLPKQRPDKDKPLNVEALLTWKGVKALEEDFSPRDFNEPDKPQRLDWYVQRTLDAPKEKRYLALFYADEQESLEDIQAQLEEEGGLEDMCGVVDVEMLLNAITGKTFRTEEDYLNALEDLIGAEPLQKYREEWIGSYRGEKAFRFQDVLEYELRRTEDFAYVMQHYEEYASALGYKEEYNTIYEESIAVVALKQVLGAFALFPSAFQGLTARRILEYYNVPSDIAKSLQGWLGVDY